MATIAEIFENMNNGDVIDFVEGVVVKIYAPMAAGDKGGSLQNGMIQDDEGSEGKVTFSDVKINDKTVKGQRIRIESVTNPRGKSGVKVKDHATHGRAIWVTGSAKITYPGGGNHSFVEDNAPPAAKGGFKRGPGATPPPQAGNDKVNAALPRGPVRTPEERLGDLADLLAACTEQVKIKLLPVLADILVDERQDVILPLVSTLYIQCDKSGLTNGWIDRSNRPLPKPPTDPAQWRECYINSKGSKLHGKKLSELAKNELLELFNYFDTKQLNTPLAECVYRAATDLDIIPTKTVEPEPVQPELTPDEEDEVPF